MPRTKPLIAQPPGADPERLAQLVSRTLRQAGNADAAGRFESELADAPENRMFPYSRVLRIASYYVDIVGSVELGRRRA